MSLALLLDTELRVDREAGFEVFGLSAPGPYVEHIERLGVRHVALPALTRSWDLRRDREAAQQLWQTLRTLRLDVLHTHNPKTGVLGRILGRLARVPVVVNTCHGLWASPDDPLPKRAAVYGTEAVASLFSDTELFQNAQDRAALLRLVPRHHSVVVGNGTDLSRFQPNAAARRRVRSELGMKPDDVLVGGVGRRVAEKGICEFAAMAERLSDRAHFVWVGPDDPAKTDQVDASDDHVRFLGLRLDIEAVYAALDVFVLPSYREGFSRSAMEAAATGCALVLSDIRGCREIGEDERDLLLVAPRDVDALAAAVRRLVDDPGFRTKLADNARRRAVSSFDQREVAAASIAAYRAVADRKGLSW